MVDLIDRQSLLKKVAKHKAKDTMPCLDFTKWSAFEWTKGDIYRMILEEPRVQPLYDEEEE